VFINGRTGRMSDSQAKKRNAPPWTGDALLIEGC
jgi:hypothetical protein